MQPTEEQTAARNFFIAYYGPRPKASGYRKHAERKQWYAILTAFTDAAGYAENLTATKKNQERRSAEGDPLAGSMEVEVEKAEAAGKRAAEIRSIYEKVLATGELPEYWRGHSGRPGAKRAGRDFEKYLVERKRNQPDQPQLFS